MFQKALKKLTGLPDQAITGVASIIPRKNSANYVEYMNSLSFYEKFNERESFFQLPDDAPEMEEIECTVDNGIKNRVLRFNSRYEVRNPAVVDDFQEFSKNMSGYLHLWQAEGATRRPMVLCLHGFMMGDVKLAYRMFRIEKLLEMGVDVGVFVLPHHGLRTPSVMKQHILAPENIPMTVETIGQCMHDLHSAVLWLSEDQKYDRIGMIGASLGGYCGALYSTLKNIHEFLFMVVPAVNFQDHFVPKKRYFSFSPDKLIKEKSYNALNLVTPEFYNSQLKADDMAVVMHADDKMNFPELTRSFASKWGINNIIEIDGGHWLYFDQKARGRYWYNWLNKKGFSKSKKA